VPRPRTVDDAAILDAALNLVHQHGPARLTFAALAAEVGLSPATLVQRFGTKRALLVATAQRGLSIWTGAFTRVRARTPLATIEAALAKGTYGIASRAELANSVAFLQMDLSDPELGAMAREGALTVRRRVADLLQAAQDDGSLRADADVAALAEVLETTYHGAMIGWALSGEGTLERWMRRQVRAALRPWRTPS
jgi:AcrR family transcriptional regulator